MSASNCIGSNSSNVRASYQAGVAAQIRWVAKGDAVGQRQFIHIRFGVPG